MYVVYVSWNSIYDIYAAIRAPRKRLMANG